MKNLTFLKTLELWTRKVVEWCKQKLMAILVEAWKVIVPRVLQIVPSGRLMRFTRKVRTLLVTGIEGIHIILYQIIWLSSACALKTCLDQYFKIMD